MPLVQHWSPGIPEKWFSVKHSVTIVDFTPDGTVTDTGVNEHLFTNGWVPPAPPE